MKNNVYVRSNRSILTISLSRILFILPVIIYGFYKNGIYLYQNNYITLFNMFRPLIIIFGGAIIAAGINIFYEKILKNNKSNLLDVLFSSFTIEYAILIGCVSSINTNLLIYFSTLTIVLFVSKFMNNRINVMCLIFLLIYGISCFFSDYNFANYYEMSKDFSYTIMDYLIGRGAGGIASTHIIFLILAMFGLFITNNSKTNITLTSIVTVIICLLIIHIFNKSNIFEILFHNNYLFIFSLIATDSVTSSYTNSGMLIYGVLIGILTAIISIINPIIAPYIAILIVSLFNILIDKYSYLLKKS